MIETIKQLFAISAAQNINAFCYMLHKIPLIKRLIPQDIYARIDTKQRLMKVVHVASLLIRVIQKLFYLMLAVFLPALLLAESLQLPVFLHAFFCMSCIGGSWMNSKVLSNSRMRFIAIKIMGMDAQRYIRADLAMQYSIFFLSYLPALCFVMFLFGATVLQMLCVFLFFVGIRFFSQGILLWIYSKTDIKLVQKNWFAIPVMLLAPIAAYLPLLFALPLGYTTFLTNPLLCVIMAALGGIGFAYIMAGYQGYSTQLRRTIDASLLSAADENNARHAAFSDVAMKEKDLQTTTRQNMRVANKRGFAYLNALFFLRHRRQIRKPVIIRVALVGVVFILFVAFSIMQPAQANTLAARLPGMLPNLVFLMYFISTTGKACRAMFYNCDNSLLRYGFYRQRDALLKNFAVRLGRLSLYSLCIAFSICLCIVGMQLICHMPIFTVDMLCMLVAVLLLSIFFTVHHLFVYYIFQPYSTESTVKSPLYTILNYVVYFLCFFAMQLDTGNVLFSLIVIGATALYCTVALLLVYRLADKTFRVK
ncbi:hypothetical protein LJC55_03775 [Eubacteriales bacterium OttesenSCG-928-N14]|nr:hypothetical protein [Eubacteriales bacterium OttesenSCG-928-N14]